MRRHLYLSPLLPCSLADLLGFPLPHPTPPSSSSLLVYNSPSLNARTSSLSLSLPSFPPRPLVLSSRLLTGNHSPSHVAKIKPAITDLMQREHLTATLDPHNGGVLVVQLQGQGGGKGSGQFLRELEGSKDNDCVVM